MRSRPQVVSRLLLSLPLAAVGSWVVSAQVPQQTPDSAPVRWTTIEIVTNNFDSVERLRKATGIRPGALLAKSDPQVQQACDAIRREVPAKVVSCMQLFGAKVDGYVDAEYIVEIDDDAPSPPAPTNCLPVQLALDLTALRDEWGRVMLHGGESSERALSHEFHRIPGTCDPLWIRPHE